jgi:hypothetical protein
LLRTAPLAGEGPPSSIVVSLVSSNTAGWTELPRNGLLPEVAAGSAVFGKLSIGLMVFVGINNSGSLAAFIGASGIDSAGRGWGAVSFGGASVRSSATNRGP